MRLPGFSNHKAPKAACELMECEPARANPLRDLRMLVPVAMVPAVDSPPCPPSPESIAGVTETERAKRWVAYVDKLPAAESGAGGHDATLRVACELVRFGIPQESGLPMPLMKKFNERCTPPWSDKELAHKVRSAYEKSAHEFGIRLVDDGRLAKLEERAKLRNDLGNGSRFARQHGSDVRWNPIQKQWFQWDGRRFKPVVEESILERAKQTAISIFDEAKAESDDDRRKALARHAHDSQNLSRLNAMIQAARSDLVVMPDRLDADPCLLNVGNGIVDLRTGELHPHSRDALCTKLCKGNYRPAAPALIFTAFLQRIFRSRLGLIPYLQKVLGYASTGRTDEQKFFLLHGGGANGKSTLLDVASYVLGDYATKAAEGLLMCRKDSAHPTELADLAGARLVVAAETEEGKRLNSARMKDLTGEKTLKTRRMHSDFYSVTITQKFFICTNHTPAVTDDSHGFWRRVDLLAFLETIDLAERDADLPAKLQAECDGILTWIVQGAVQWFREGLGRPPEVETATEEYRRNADGLGEFVRECCQEDAKAEVPFSFLYDAYTRWSRDDGREPETKTRFGGYLRDRGFVKGSDRQNNRVYRGIKLKAATAAPSGGTNVTHQ
jgi:putative DNA primase/helicase